MLQPEIQQLIDRVEAFEIDPGEKSLSFASRLARENRWTIPFSERVIREYKRFCILALASGHHVTPSEEVDQAWHLHLTYTRSYWERFCGETLRRPLHHEPTAGGASEGAKFHDWYSETLKSYVGLFGEAPPHDIWPEPKKRFSHAGEWKWINVGHYWLVPRVYLWPIVSAVMVLAFSILPGCAPDLVAVGEANWLLPIIAADIFPFSLDGQGFLIFYGVLCAIGFATLTVLRNAPKPSDHNRLNVQASDLSVEELAVLSGGGARLAHLAITRLYAEDRIETSEAGWFSSRKFVAKSGKKPIASSIDRDLYAEIERGTATSQLLKSVKPHYDRVNNKLIEFNLRDDSTFHSKTGMVIVAVILSLGLMRLIQGISAGRPVGYLVVCMFVFAVLGIFLNYRRSKITGAGKACLEQSKIGLSALPHPAKPEIEQGARSDLVLMSVALLGTSAIAGFDGFGTLLPVLKNMSSQSSSSGGGCGAGCGAGCSGGGGGCGGCGGCSG